MQECSFFGRTVPWRVQMHFVSDFHRTHVTGSHVFSDIWTEMQCFIHIHNISYLKIKTFHSKLLINTCIDLCISLDHIYHKMQIFSVVWEEFSTLNTISVHLTRKTCSQTGFTESSSEIFRYENKVHCATCWTFTFISKHVARLFYRCLKYIALFFSPYKSFF